MRNSVLQLIHADACCHMKNLNNFLQQVSRRAYWYSWRKDSEIFLRTCLRCQQYFRGNPPKQGGLKPQIGLVSMPGQRYSIDLVGPLPPSQGYKYIFTAVENFSRYLITAPLRDKTAESVARTIIDKIILVHSCPD